MCEAEMGSSPDDSTSLLYCFLHGLARTFADVLMDVFPSTPAAVLILPGVIPVTSLVVFVVAQLQGIPLVRSLGAARRRVICLSILDNCGIMDSDLDDVARCMDVFGRDTMTRV